MLKFRVDYKFLLILQLIEVAASNIVPAPISNDGKPMTLQKKLIIINNKGQMEELELSKPLVKMQALASNSSSTVLLKSIESSTELPIITATPLSFLPLRKMRQQRQRRKQLRRRHQPLEMHRRPLEEDQTIQQHRELRRRKLPKHMAGFQPKNRRQNFQQGPKWLYCPQQTQQFQYPLKQSNQNRQYTQQSLQQKLQQTQKQWQQPHQNYLLYQSGLISGYQPNNQSQSLSYWWELSLAQGVAVINATEFNITDTSTPESKPFDN